MKISKGSKLPGIINVAWRRGAAQKANLFSWTPAAPKVDRRPATSEQGGIPAARFDNKTLYMELVLTYDMKACPQAKNYGLEWTERGQDFFLHKY